jgi:predicted small lipoprotein YifL
MKRLLVLAGCAIVLLALAGCGRQNRRTLNLPPSAGQKNEFPEVMVGVWESQTTDYKWAFKLERDGSISKMFHVLAKEVDLNEGGVFWEGPDPGTYAVFVMGPCEAEYNKRTRELKVKIILDYFQMVLPQGQVEGTSNEYFQGPVSADGKTWKAD